MSNQLSVTLIGGPTVLLELGGVRLLTDPTFDPPRQFARPDGNGVRKLRGPAVEADQLGPVDAVLLSHDTHWDNLDEAGRAYLSTVERLYTTEDGAGRLGGTACGLAPWESTTLAVAPNADLEVIGLPAQHGPTPDAQATAGPVTGFLLRGADLPTVYVSGDNASVDVVEEIVDRFGAPEVSILFVGGASVPFLFDGAHLTLTAEGAVAAARRLGSNAVIPVHLNGWSHYTHDEADLERAFATAGLGRQLRLLRPGQVIRL